ncbi:MAG: hypothetical protein H6621_12685 [Halobacteriovoraceae bacterium]|nr:hypothetical protein [Halobacteriovoraceae bacterium]MCB9095917.1 hypothetical protein [Halobacteriovoraceae bacterium]
MRVLLSLSFILLFSSCGNIVQESVDSFTEQSEGLLSFSANFSHEDIKGVWMAEESQAFTQLNHIFVDAKYLPHTLYEKQTVEEFADSCNINAETKENIDVMEATFFLKFDNGNYKYFAETLVHYYDGSEEVCIVTVGEGQYTILGSNVLLKDINTTAEIELYEDGKIGVSFTK